MNRYQRNIWEAGHCGITVKGGRDAIVGTCGYNVWICFNRCAEIGYDWAKRCWNQGIMTEGFGAALAFGFDEMWLNRVEADVVIGNDSSVRVLQRLGF